MISIIVPCYKEEEVLPIFYEETTRVLKEIGMDYEILLVNDGSTDHTLAVMKALAEKDAHIKYLSFSRNFGKEAAMYAGFVNAKGDYVAVMDADLQDPPHLLPEMLKIIQSGEYDSVATRRETRKGEPMLRSACARMFYRIINKISDADIVDGARDFRLMTRDMVDAIISMSEYNRFTKGIMGWIGFRTCWLAYENVERKAGTTKWNFWGLFRYAINGILDFSQAPLKISSWFGLFLTAFSFAWMLIIIVGKLIFDNPVAGWPSMACIILFVSGIQLFCLGIMGQYIARIYTETKGRPHYIISESNSEDVIRIR